jgi:hypothetical protein
MYQSGRSKLSWYPEKQQTNWQLMSFTLLSESQLTSLIVTEATEER